MFNSITWGEYLYAVGIVLVCYYIVIGLLFFHREILRAIGIKIIETTGSSTNQVEFRNIIMGKNHEDILEAEQHSSISSPLLSFTDEIKAYLQEASKNMIRKDDALKGLHSIASKYPSIKESAFKMELANEVLKEANINYPNQFMANDINQLWD